ncbi:hypothetical protein ACH4KN_09510 [Streptomyces sp. NPDC017546]|uniref:hypothetical protein n=1 Tax=Streptomyces sp. NPDC017546 TaxID=3365001 RepID=UPI003787A495
MATPSPSPIESLFLDMIESLKQCDVIRVAGERKGAISDIAENSSAGFSQLTEACGINIDPSLTDKHVRYLDLGIHWYATDASTRGGGEFFLHELIDALASAPPDTSSTQSDAESKLFQQLRVIDYHPEGGTISFAAVRLLSNTIAPRVWAHHFPYGTFELDLDYSAYLDALLLTKGFHGWHFLYADIRLTDPKYAPLVALIRAGLDLLKVALPDPRHEELEVRLAERLD